MQSKNSPCADINSNHKLGVESLLHCNNIKKMTQEPRGDSKMLAEKNNRDGIN
jgi:hypothetical protein